MAVYRSQICLCLLLIGLIFISPLHGAPRHHLKKQSPKAEDASSRSYIDIDASDPFKVPKSSHYMDQTVPDYEKSEPQIQQDPEGEARATVENNETGEEDTPSPAEDPTPVENTPTEENAPQEDAPAAQSEGEDAGQSLNSDLPASVNEKINEIASNKADIGGTENGKPIEIEEKDLQKLLHNGAGGSEGGENVEEGGEPSS